jgi:hypothetical protein
MSYRQRSSSRIRMELSSFLIYSKAVYKPVWHIPLLSVQWIIPDDGQGNSPKHVVSFPNYIWGISASSWFYYKEMFHGALWIECKIKVPSYNRCPNRDSKDIVPESEGRYICQFVWYASYLLALLEFACTHILSARLPSVLFYFVFYLLLLYWHYQFLTLCSVEW